MNSARATSKDPQIELGKCLGLLNKAKVTVEKWGESSCSTTLTVRQNLEVAFHAPPKGVIATLQFLRDQRLSFHPTAIGTTADADILTRLLGKGELLELFSPEDSNPPEAVKVEA